LSRGPSAAVPLASGPQRDGDPRQQSTAGLLPSEVGPYSASSRSLQNWQIAAQAASKPRR